MKCQRCGDETNVHILSMFNNEDICSQCKTEEKQAPGYKYAAEREAKELINGNTKFAGVGLSVIDTTYLVALRHERGKKKAS